MPTTFLRQVAAHYAGQAGLEDRCFAFPNRRSGQFFEHELARQFTTPRLLPRVTTLPQWLEEHDELATASTVDQVFVLYQAYSTAFGEAASAFDKFVYWAPIILTDFNDVDMALADADRLYTNLSDLRELSTDYLDSELKHEIGRIFNIQFTDSDTFWKNFRPTGDSPDTPSRQYFTLWEKLCEIYHTFHSLLAERGQATQGMLYRRAAERLSRADDTPGTGMTLVGFAALSVSEDKIFKALQHGGAHFWWDDAAPELRHPDNPGGQLVRLYSTRYPSPEPLAEVSTAERRITAVSVPSTVGQAKWAFHMVDQMSLEPPEREPAMQALALPRIDATNAINTALVLPDENLFVPLLSSVPPSVEQLNVTLGYPMRHSGIVALMHIVARAHRQATLDKSTGQWRFYREDVRDVLSHPVVKAAFTGDVVRLSQDIEQSRDYNVSANAFAGTALEPLFITIDDTADTDQTLHYIDRLIAFADALDRRVRVRHGAQALHGADAPAGEADLLPLQSAFIVHYIEALRDVRRAIAMSGTVPATGDAIFHLVDRITANLTVPFTGEPLAGLQLMGILEARCLDFDNVVILSMNERVFPSRRPMSSFIPDYLRSAHLMPTNTYHEAVATYHFYRLLGRARHVTLIYDSSAQGAGSSEPSRYIGQLEKVYNLPVRHVSVDSHIEPVNELVIEVAKTADMVQCYRSDDSLPGGTVLTDTSLAKLSASAIKHYLTCPLAFYLRSVRHLPDDNETTDFMDAPTFGTIVHDTLQQLYYPNEGDASVEGGEGGTKRSEPHRVTAAMIEHFDKHRLAPTVVQQVNKTYFHRTGADLDLPLSGDALILQETIETYARSALRYDLDLLKRTGSDIEVLECEVSHPVVLDLGEGVKINFTFIIDRLDRVGDTVRLIDYKTGRDETDFKDANQLLNDRHALLQLLLYCNALHQMRPEFDQIQPMIYKLREMSKTGMMLNKQQYVFTLGEQLNREFIDLLRAHVGDLLDTAKPFTQAEAKSPACRYCGFAEFCRR